MVMMGGDSPEVPDPRLVVDCSAWLAPLPVPQATRNLLVGECERVELLSHENEDWGPVILWRSEREEVHLSLRRDVYVEGEHPKPWGAMTIDTMEPLVHALLVAFLDRQSSGPEGPADHLRERSQRVMGAEPEAQRQEAYVDALASFGSHIVTLRVLIERAFLRARAEGRDLCSQVEGGGPLFRLWKRSFDDGYYPGEYLVPGEGPGDSRPRISSGALGRADKDWLLDQIAPGEWTGEPERDFGAQHCPGVDSVSGGTSGS